MIWLLVLLLAGCAPQYGDDVQRWMLEITERVNEHEERITELEEEERQTPADRTTGI